MSREWHASTKIIRLPLRPALPPPRVPMSIGVMLLLVYAVIRITVDLIVLVSWLIGAP